MMSLSRNQFTLRTVFLLITAIAIVLSIIRNPGLGGVLTVVVLGSMAVTIGFWGVQAVCSGDKIAVKLIGVVLVSISIWGSIFLIFGLQILSAALVVATTALVVGTTATAFLIIGRYSVVNRRPFQFSLRKKTLILIFVFGGLLSSPVANISSETCDRIHAGMTTPETEAIVGGPQGTYDGLKSIHTDSPATGKAWEQLYWADMKGELIVALDDRNLVTKANFYPSRSFTWSWKTCAMERLTRRHRGDLSLVERVFLSLFLTAIVVFGISISCISVQSHNLLAKHGTVGLFAGPAIVAVVCLNSADPSLLSIANEIGIALSVLMGALAGTAIGLFLGASRKTRYARRASKSHAEDLIRQATEQLAKPKPKKSPKRRPQPDSSNENKSVKQHWCS